MQGMAFHREQNIPCFDSAVPSREILAAVQAQNTAYLAHHQPVRTQQYTNGLAAGIHPNKGNHVHNYLADGKPAKQAEAVSTAAQLLSVKKTACNLGSVLGKKTKRRL